jgi:AAA family ATP:ADP antiporter
MTNPLQALMTVRREELPLSLLMCSYFFLVITTFWILKPIKRALFMEYYDQSGVDLFSWHFNAAQAETLAKILNMFVAILAVIVFSWLARRLRRQQLSYVFCCFFLLSFLFYRYFVDAPGDVTVWSFYLLGDLWTTLMVVTFFAFLNDSVTPDRAKRLYGLIVMGGVLGGAFGSTFVRVWVMELQRSSWLWICIVLTLIIAVLAMSAGSLVRRDPPPELVKEEAPQDKQNAALEGAKLVFRSRYLTSIVVIVALYEIASQVLDFQFGATVNHYLDGPAIGQHYATVYAISNWVALLVQLFLTTFVMTRFGLTTALLILPAAIALGSGGFLVIPILWAGSLLNTADSGFAYSMNQSAKEALYVPTSKEEKYKAKAFIDMFVQRFAKVLAIGVSLITTMYFSDFSTVRWLSLFTLAIVAVWIFAALYAGRQFHELTEKEEAVNSAIGGAQELGTGNQGLGTDD